MDKCKAECEDSSRKFNNVLSLPVELLVYIISFLSTARDKAKLRCVSRTLRVVSETPSLWSEFVWPLYDCREERSVMNVLKACGDYIKRLVFPDHVTPTKLFQMLILCSNVTQLCLPPEDEVDLNELRIAVQQMDHLEKLEVQLSADIKPLLQIGGLKELTVHVLKQKHSLCIPWIQEWMKNNFIPYNLNLITEMFEIDDETRLIESFLDWNFTPLINYTSCFKYYYSYSIPLRLISSLPEFQLEIGATANLPFVKASDLGILGLDLDLLVVTSGVCNGKLVYKADTGSPSVCRIFRRRNIVLNKMVNTLNCITEFNFAYIRSLHSGHLEQVAIACPNLQRLSLEGNMDCLSSLQGLQTIACHCRDLCGLSLLFISIEQMEDHVRMWEIVSQMKLTHLAVDICTLYHNCNDVCEEKLISVFQECSTLKAIQLEPSCTGDCEVCEEGEIKWSLLSHFPMLKYCWLVGDGQHSNLLQEVINGCKKLMILSCLSYNCLLISPVFTTQLQQVYIKSGSTNIPDIFMETVSTHGRLLHVVLSVNSVTVEGVSNLIMNSTGLLTLKVHAQQLIYENIYGGIKSKDNVRKHLERRFSSRKLFTVGTFMITQGYHCVCEFHHGTDLFPLWPFYHFD